MTRSSSSTFSSQVVGEAISQSMADVFNASLDSIYIKDRQGKYLFINHAGAQALGMAVADIVGQTDSALFGDQVALQLRAADERVIATGERYECDETVVTAAGRRVFLTVKVPLVGEDGTLQGVSGVSRDVTRSRRNEQILKTIMDGTAATTGADYFQNLVLHLSQSLGMRYGVLGAVVDETATQMVTLAACDGDALLPNMEYALSDTPCENVIKGDVCIYPDCIQELFPDDEILVDMNARSYMGIPLSATCGKVIGHLVLIHDEPMESTEDIRSVMEVFSARAAAEVERHLIDQRLRNSEERYRALVQHAPYCIHQIDLDGHFTSMNKAGLNMVGLADESCIVGMPYLKAVASADRSRVATLLDKAIDGEMSEFEFRSAGQRDFASSFVPIRNSEGKVTAIMGITRDITDRNLAYASLRDSEERYRHLFQLSPTGILVIASDGIIREANPVVCESLGYGDGELIGMHVSAITRHDRAVIDENILEILNGEHGKWHEGVNLRKDGSECIMELRETRISLPDGLAAVLSVSHDVTQHRKAEREQRRSDAQLRHATRIAQIGSWTWDVSDDRYVLSPEAMDIFQYSPDEFDGNEQHLASDRIHHDDRERVLQHMFDVFENQLDPTIAFRIVWPSGQVRNIRVTCEVEREPGGTPLRAFGIVQDMTDQIESARALNEVTALFEGAVEQSPAGIIVAEAPDMRIRIINSAAVAIRGGDTSIAFADIPFETHIANWNMLNADGQRISPDELPLPRAILRGDISRDMEMILRRGDGTDRWVNANAAPILAADGTIIAGIVVFHDITVQKIAQQALIQSEQRFRHYFESPLVGIAMAAPDKQLLEVNDKLCDMLGYSREELLAMDWSLLTHPDDIAENTKVVSQVMRGEIESYSLRKRYYRKDGGLVYVNLSARPVRRHDGSVDYFVTLIEDITDRVRAEAALLESEQRFRNYFELPLVGISMSTPDKKIIEVNDKFCDLLGYSREELLAMDWSQVSHPDDIAENVDLVEQTIAGDIDGFSMRKRYVHKSGGIVHTNLSSRPVRNDNGAVEYFVTLTEDVSEQVEAERALLASENRFRSYFELPLVGIAMADAQGGLLEVNDRLCDIMGYSAAQLIELGWSGLTHPDDFAESKARIAQVVAGESNGFSITKRYVRKDGSIIHAAVSARPVHREDGSFDYLVAIIDDITQKVRTQELLEAQRDSEKHFLEQLTHLVEIGNELANANTLDDLHRQAIELGRSQLGFDRISWWRTTDEPQKMKGTYGTDEHGQIRDERGLTFMTGHDDFNVGGGSKYNLTKDVDLFDEQRRVVGSGDRVWVQVSDSQRLVGFLSVDNLLSGKPIQPTDCDLLILYSSMLGHLSQRKQFEAALRESENKYRAIVETTTDWIWERDSEGQHTFSNKQVESILGYSVQEFKSLVFFELLHPEDKEEVSSKLPGLMATRSGWRNWVIRLRHKNGNYRYIESSAESYSDSHGQFLGYRGSDRDITERYIAAEAIKESKEHFQRLAESNKRLLAEVNHRVRNNLGGLNALIGLAKQRATSVDDFAQSMLHRIGAMARTHTLLAESGWDTVELHKLVSRVIAAAHETAPRRISVNMQGEPVLIEPRLTSPLAMTLVELFNNSVKHGAHRTSEGHIEIEWLTTQRGKEQWVDMHARPTGGPLIEDVNQASLGTELIRGFVELELNGSCKLTYPPEGAAHTIAFCPTYGNRQRLNSERSMSDE